jgi:hypothetical protein
VPDFLPTIVAVDLEPDRRPVARRDQASWNGWAACHRLFSESRAAFEAATGAPPRWSWFFRTDPQVEAIWGSPGFAIESRDDLVRDLVAHDDEMGVHCHPFRWDDAGSQWLCDFADPSWVAEAVDRSLEGFERATGRRCRSFRFGARWLDDATVRRLDAAGVAHDLTIEPGFPPGGHLPSEEPSTGDFPDYTDAPRAPYRPGAHFLDPGDGSRGPWMLPVSTGTPERPWRAFRRRAGSLLRPAGRRARPWAPLCLFESPRVFGRVLDRLLASRATRHLLVVVRSDAAVLAESAHVVENLRILADRARTHPLRVVRPDEAIATLAPEAPARR